MPLSCLYQFQGYYLAPVNFMAGIHSSLKSKFKLNSGYLKTDTLEDHRDIINLLKQVPRMLEQIKVLLQKGVENGMTYHNASMFRVPEQFETLLNFTSVEETTFYDPFKALIGDSDEFVEIREEAKEVIQNQLMPAFEN